MTTQVMGTDKDWHGRQRRAGPVTSYVQEDAGSNMSVHHAELTATDRDVTTHLSVCIHLSLKA